MLQSCRVSFRTISYHFIPSDSRESRDVQSYHVCIKIIDSAQPPGDSRDLVTCFLSAMTVSSPGVVHVKRSRALSVQAGRQADGSDGDDGLSLAILA